MVCIEDEEKSCHGSSSSPSTNYMVRSMRTIRSKFDPNTTTTTTSMSFSDENDNDVFSEVSDISGELLRLASSTLPLQDKYAKKNQEPCQRFLQTRYLSSQILMESEDIQLTIKICVDSLNSSSVSIKRSAAAKLRLLAKNSSDNRALIGESGAIPALIPLLRSTDPLTQENTVTALLNLSLLDNNKPLILGAVKSIIYVLKTTGSTEVSKQNSACVLLSLALVDDDIKACIGAYGAIPPLVSLLINASSHRGKKDALTTLYKVCSIKVNKQRAVTAGVVKPLAGLLLHKQEEGGMTEKALVVLSSLGEIEEGRISIVEQGGTAGLLNVIKENATSVKGKEIGVVILLQLVAVCKQQDERGRNKLVILQLLAEGAIPTLVALTTTSTRAKHKAERLLGYLRQEAVES